MSSTKFPRRIHARRDDQAVSPVIGTILMVAVTVVLGATVYAAVNGFGSDAVKDTPQVAFKAQAIDTDADGLTDRIKVSYMSGPDNIGPSLTLTVAKADGTAVAGTTNSPATWNPGAFAVFVPAAADGKAFLVTVSAFGNTVVDQAIALDE